MIIIGVRWRLIALASAVGLMGVLIVLTTLNSQRQATELRTRLSQVDSESFGIAEHFKDALREVTDKMLRYRTVRDPVAWEEFLQAQYREMGNAWEKKQPRERQK